MAPGARTVTVALAFALLGGCGGDGGGGAQRRAATPAPSRGASAPASRPPSDGEQLDGLLADRGAALEAGDVAAYAATSIGSQRARDRVAARRAARLPLAGLVLRAHGARIRGDIARLRATISYRFRG